MTCGLKAVDWRSKSLITLKKLDKFTPKLFKMYHQSLKKLIGNGIFTCGLIMLFLKRYKQTI